MKTPNTRRHAYPVARPDRQPTPWWYYGRALYVSRRDYFKIYCALMATLGIPFVFLALYFDWQLFKIAALGAGTVSLFYLGYSLLPGMYRMYGSPSRNYVRRLLDEANAGHAQVVADLHIGTYRHSYLLAEALPTATIHSIDCWNEAGDPHEIAIRDVRDLECAPRHHPRIRTATAVDCTLPLADASCDAVVLGFGTHEIPHDGSRAKVFDEAKRVLKPGGKVLLFEHGNDFHNIIIFGPVIAHVVTRDEWLAERKARFAEVGYARTSQAVDLFWATKAAAIGTACRELPKPRGIHSSLGNWAVVATFSLISAAVVAYLPASFLVGIYWGIAFLGLAWPWLMIGVALGMDRLTSARSTDSETAAGSPAIG